MAFHTTRWSLVARAGTDDLAGRQALAELCQAYWQPVYWLYRRLRVDPERARDLTQGLFAHLLERGDLRRADPQRGRFRAWLRACARHWLADEHERERAHKRGGGAVVLSLDVAAEESRYGLQAVDHLDAEALFERRWAQTVIERALVRLEREETTARRGALFPHLRVVLEGEGPRRPWADLARELDTSEGALKVAAHRLRARFRDCLVAEVRDTLPDDVAPGDEVNELRRSLDAGAETPRQSR
ncbi:MAG: hypothetical protein R3F56_21460 [Planctomycetota bacterium]